MPIYEYICEECQAAFERIVLNAKAKVACPKCGSQRAKQQLSVFSAPKGNGGASRTAAESPCSGVPSSCGRCGIQ